MSSALRTAVAPALRALPFLPAPAPSLSTLAQRALQSGALVPDALILPLTKARLSELDCSTQGWVLDGLPRTPVQASALLSAPQTRPDAVVHLHVPADAIRARLVHRRRDPVTGATYNMKMAPPSCEKILARLETRPDDAPAVVEKRLRTYAESMPRVWAAFERDGVPVVRVTVQAGDGVEDVQRRVMEEVDGCGKVVVAGPPGCGKGTHGLQMAHELGAVHVSTGDLLRQVAGKSPEREDVVGLVALATGMVEGTGRVAVASATM